MGGPWFTMTPGKEYAVAPGEAHRYVGELTRGEQVQGVYLCASKDLKTTRTGSLYLQLELADRSGRIGAKFWDASEGLFHAFEVDDFLRVRGGVDVYQGTKQLVLTDLRPVSPEGLNLADYLPSTEQDVEALFAELRQALEPVTDRHLRVVIDAFLGDEALMEQFRTAPAAIRYHHAYLGGLLEHTVGVMRLALAACERYAALNRDLLLTGVFLHDMGKVDEMTYSRTFDYTDPGNLLGHLVIGLGMLERRVRDWETATGEAFPEDLLAVLEHLVISHHGEYEYGSCKLPMTAEALALHYLDNLDAKVYAIGREIAADADPQRRWTEFSRMFRRRLYKGLATDTTDSDADR